VWTQHQLVPNSLIAPCTFILKVRPFRDFVQAMPELPKIYIGYKPHETKRHKKTLESYAEALPAAQVEYPLFSVIGECKLTYTTPLLLIFVNTDNSRKC
jgi:hypothetical protein